MHLTEFENWNWILEMEAARHDLAAIGRALPKATDNRRLAIF
jgi:hypothetical protein